MSRSPDSPTMAEVLSQILDDRAAQIGVCIPGKVEDFDAQYQTATISPTVQKSDGSSLPVLQNVPVVFPVAFMDLSHGGPWTGLLIVADCDWHTWFRTGEITPPETESNHDLGNAFFLPGVCARPDRRYLVADSTVLLPPSATGIVRLGIFDASHEVPRGDDWITAINAWTLAVVNAIIGLGGADLNAARTTLSNALTAALCDRVKVD